MLQCYILEIFIILQVNGIDVSSMTQREIVQFMRSADKVVTIQAKRRINKAILIFS